MYAIKNPKIYLNLRKFIEIMFWLNKLWNWFHIFPKTMLFLMVPNLELFESFLFASVYVDDPDYINV